MTTNTYKTIFTINYQEKIIIQYNNSLADINYCSEASIILDHNNNLISLAQDSAYNNINRLTIFLKKALNNELTLHESLEQDIGFLFNQYSAYICGEPFKESTNLTYINKNNERYWPGNDYHVWAHDFIAWLYNDKNGNIIFEVTPFYPYMYCEPEEEPNYIPYNEWIKTYKPYLIREIPATTAQEWLNQAEFIIKTIEYNESE